MAYTQQQVSDLEAAIARGATKLRLGDEEVTYASLADMRRLLASMKAELASGAAPSLTISTFKTNRGL